MTDVCREMAAAHAQDDPLECGQQWGMIQNRNVKVRGINIFLKSGADAISSGELEPAHHLHLQLLRHLRRSPSLWYRPNDLCRRKQLRQIRKASPKILSLPVILSLLSSLQESLQLPSGRRVISSARSQRLSHPSPSQQIRFVTLLGALFYAKIITDRSILATQSAAEDGQLSSIQIVDISLLTAYSGAR